MSRGPYDTYKSQGRESELRRARLEQRHTQAEAAKKIGITRSRLARIETGSLAAPGSGYSWCPYEVTEAYQAYVARGIAPIVTRRSGRRRSRRRSPA